MEIADLAILFAAGLAGGFVAGVVGVGGGIVFAPVLFFSFTARGMPPDVVTPLTLGSSLFCTLVASSASAHAHSRAGVVDTRVAWIVGSISAASVFLTSRFVTTRPWYDASLFQAVFGLVLLLVAFRLIRRRGALATDENVAAIQRPTPLVALGVGAVTGAVSTAAGVGGGVVMVPAFRRLLSFPMRRAVGTSSAAIVIVSLAGVLSYGWLGRAANVPPWSFGYVNIPEALVLAVPAAITARFGAWTAHRVDTRLLQVGFGVFSLIVALRLLWAAAQP